MKNKISGVLFCGIIAVVAMVLSSIHLGNIALNVVGAPVFAILIGMVITLCKKDAATNDKTKEGVAYTSKKLLQYAVILLGFSLNPVTIGRVGWQSLPVILSTISISLLMAFIMGKLLKIDGNSSALIGIGSSICGGSAIAAAAPVLDADDKQIAQAISVVFLFNVLAALIFPYFGHGIGLGSGGFGVFAGTAVNDTSSVTATATVAENIYGVDGILSTAVTVKLTRTLAIIPITFILALIQSSKSKKENNGFSLRKSFPMFILYFLVASVISGAVGLLPASAFTDFYNTMFIPAMKFLAKFLIAMAMAAIGLKTDIVDLVKKGGKPILLGFICWVSITCVSLLVQYFTGLYFWNL